MYDIQLLPFQKEGITLINWFDGNCIIGDDMGLGKTIQALYWCAMSNNRALIICPSNVKEGWYNEITTKFSLTVAIIHKGKDLQKLTYDTDFIIISYGLCSQIYKKKKILYSLLDNNYHTMIVDESHYLMTPSTKRTIAVSTIAKYMRYHLLLTGTPIYSRAINLYSQIRIVKPDLHTSIAEFKSIYGIQDDLYGKPQPPTEIGMYRLKQALGLLYYGRKKHEVLDQLPSKTRQMRWYDKPNNYKEKIEEILIETENKLTVIGKVATFLSLLMVNHTINLLQDILSNTDRKVIIFTSRKNAAKELYNILGDISLLYTGDDNIKKRGIIKEQFIKDNTIRVFIATIQSCAFGVNKLQFVADTIIFNDTTFVPAELFQAEDRIYRIGQEQPVNIYYMAYRDTYHEKIFDRLQDRAKMVNEIFQQNNKERIIDDIFNHIIKTTRK